MDVNSAIEKQLKNIEAKTGKSLAELAQFVEQSGLEKFGEKREFLKTELGLGHGDANAVINNLVGNKKEHESADPLSDLYVGSKAHLRPIHEALVQEINKFGEHETAPKKGYVSLRRKKQFALVGPATNSQIEIGIVTKGLEATGRLVAQPPGAMCQYKVRVGSVDEIDAELLGWLEHAFASAG